MDNFKEIFDYLREGTYPDGFTKDQKRNFRRKCKENYKVDNGELYFRKSGRGSKKGPETECNDVWKKCIWTIEEKDRVLTSVHGSATGGHLGRDKTVEKTCSRFYWGHCMHAEIQTFIRTCEQCQRVNDKFQKPTALLHPIPVEPQVWYQVGIDLIGPLPITPGGNKYIVTMIDYFSKWPEAAPLQDKTAAGVANFIFNTICRFGFAKIVISDQGREFVCKLNEELMKLSGTDHRVTSAYHPQSNGICERLNQTLQNILLKRVNDNQDDWDELLPAALFAIRTSKQKSTQYSPFQLMFGRKPKLPVELEFECTSEENMEEHGMEEVFGKMLEMKHKMFDDARKNIHKAQERYKKDFDKKRNKSEQNLSPGTSVLLRNSKRDSKKGDKFKEKWIGPYTIHKDLGKGRYLIRNRTGLVLKNSVHSMRLKQYFSARDEALSNPSLSDGTVVNVYPPLDNEEDSSTVMLDRMLQKVGDRMDETKHTGDKITESVTEDEMCEDRMTYQKMTEDSNLYILENQLLDSSLLWLWRTGAMQEAFRSEDDELYDLSPYLSSTEEHGLSINVDVALWLDCRNFYKIPPLQIVRDFVIVTDKLHDDFDAFVKMETKPDISILPAIELLQFWYVQKKISVSTISRYGKLYMQLNSSLLDNLCSWVVQMRQQFGSHGISIFKREEAQPKLKGPIGLKRPRSKGITLNKRQKWVHNLNLDNYDRRIIEENGLLSDKHINAAHKLLRKHFPHITGLQSTLLSQSHQFAPVSSDSIAIQIHFTEDFHWVTSTCVGQEIQLYDSFVSSNLTSSLEVQLAQIYHALARNGFLMVTRMSVQQQINHIDCGVFSIAYAYHAALGNDLSCLNFDCEGISLTVSTGKSCYHFQCKKISY